MENTKKDTSANKTAENVERKAMTSDGIGAYVHSCYSGVSCETIPTYSFYCELDEGSRFNSCRIILMPRPNCFQVVVELPMRVMCWETAEMAEYLDEINSTCLEGYEGFWTDPISEKMYYRLFSECPAEGREIEMLVNKAKKTVSEYLSDINHRLGEISKVYEATSKETGSPGSPERKAKSKGIMASLLRLVGIVDADEETDEDGEDRADAE